MYLNKGKGVVPGGIGQGVLIITQRRNTHTASSNLKGQFAEDTVAATLIRVPPERYLIGVVEHVGIEAAIAHARVGYSGRVVCRKFCRPAVERKDGRAASLSRNRHAEFVEAGVLAVVHGQAQNVHAVDAEGCAGVFKCGVGKSCDTRAGGLRPEEGKGCKQTVVGGSGVQRDARRECCCEVRTHVNHRRIVARGRNSDDNIVNDRELAVISSQAQGVDPINTEGGGGIDR